MLAHDQEDSEDGFHSTCRGKMNGKYKKTMPSTNKKAEKILLNHISLFFRFHGLLESGDFCFPTHRAWLVLATMLP